MVGTPDAYERERNSDEGFLDRRSWWPWAVGLVAAWIGLVHAALWWFDGRPVPRTRWGDENTYFESATKLLAGDPGWWPEVLWPPLYPQFVAGLTWLGGGALVLVSVVQSALLVLVAVLLFDLANRLTSSRPAALAVAACTLGYPPLAAFSHYLWPEVLHLFLFVVLIWILSTRSESPGWCALAGVALGLAVLCKSLLLPFSPILLITAVWGKRPVRALGVVVLVVGLAALTVAPTLAANQRRIGRLSIANSATFNLWVGLNDIGRESFRYDVVWPEYQSWTSSAGSHAERDRILRSRIAELVRQRGLATTMGDQLSKQYFRLFDGSCYLTDQLPGGGAQRQSGVGYLGIGQALGSVIAAVVVASILALYVAASAGLALGGCRDNRWIRTMVVFIAYNLLLFLFLHVKTRYRIQMLPAAFLGVGCLVSWYEAGGLPKPSIPRVVAGTAAAALLVFFALG